MYEIIRTFTPIFRSLNFENPRAAAAYYVNLIINFPTSLQGILNETQAIYGNEINRQALYAGRQGLQRNGIIARNYLTEDANVDFDREAYLPANPELIWRENKEHVNACWKQPEELAFRKAKVNELHEHYLKNFKKYGFGIEKGSVTGLSNVQWMMRSGINVISNNYTKRIDMMQNYLELFMIHDYSEYIEKALKQGMTERVLYDINIKRKILKDEEPLFKEYGPIMEQRINRFKRMYDNYHEQIEIRYTPLAYTTTRQAIYYNEEGPYLASDLRKLLSLDPKKSPYYIGTAYLQKELINHIKENFEAAWANGIPLGEP